jgi:hypothetical protein
MLQYDKDCLMELKEVKQTAVVLSVSFLPLLVPICYLYLR